MSLYRLRGNDDGSIVLAEACAAIEQHVLVAQARVGGKAQSRHVVSLGYRRIVESLDIGEDVRVLIPRRAELVRGQRVEHEGVIGIRGMRQFDFHGCFFCLRGCLCDGHSFLTAQFYVSAKRRPASLSPTRTGLVCLGHRRIRRGSPAPEGVAGREEEGRSLRWNLRGAGPGSFDGRSVAYPAGP